MPPKCLKICLNAEKRPPTPADALKLLITAKSGTLMRFIMATDGRKRLGTPCRAYGDAQPPAISTHSGKQLPCLPSTSTMSVSHLHRQPTPFSLTGSGVAQYSSSSCLFLSSSVVFSSHGMRGNCRDGALAGQCWIVVCRYPKSRK